MIRPPGKSSHIRYTSPKLQHHLWLVRATGRLARKGCDDSQSLPEQQGGKGGLTISLRSSRRASIDTGGGSPVL